MNISASAPAGLRISGISKTFREKVLHEIDLDVAPNSASPTCMLFGPRQPYEGIIGKTPK
jgi:hypothetical protein